MSVTAIIPHFWESRQHDLAGIVTALLTAAAPPEQVIVWNNTPRTLNVDNREIRGRAVVINASQNWGIAARFAAAYLARTEFVLFQDNDLAVQPETLLNLMDYLPAEGESVELQGRTFGPWESPYSQSSYVDGREIVSPQVVDVGLSRLSLMRRSTAMRLAAIIPPDATDDDIWTSRHSKIRIVPAHPLRAGYQNLPESEGLCRNAVAHVLRRDVLVRELWPSLEFSHVVAHV